jgi:hypothetical protein
VNLTRRELLQDAAIAAAGLAGVPPTAGRMPTRALGRAGRRVSILGFGTAPLGSDNTPPADVDRLLRLALDEGVDYVDTAPLYGSDGSRYGNAETKLRGFLRAHRKDVFLVTKANASRPTKAGMQQQVEESLKRLGVDHLDAVHVHNLGDFDMERIEGEDGAIAGLEEARKRGLLRYIGVSGHTRPSRFARILATGRIDLAMVALNFADRNNYDFEGQALPAAKKHGAAVLAMKVLGGSVGWQYDGKAKANLAAFHERAIRYALGLPQVSCAVIGLANEDEIRRAAAVARAYRPLTGPEREALLAEGREIAARRGLYYGPATG